MRKIKEKNGARTVTIILIITVAAIVFATLIGALYFTPERLAKHELKQMAMDYYENYVYPEVLGDAENESEVYARFEDYAKGGFPSVKLRQLLHHDDDKNADKEGVFDNENYYCDADETYVKITPYEPFKKTDYKLEYEYSCQKRESVVQF